MRTRRHCGCQLWVIRLALWGAVTKKTHLCANNCFFYSLFSNQAGRSSPEMQRLEPQQGIRSSLENAGPPSLRRMRNLPKGRELTSERKVEEETADLPRERKLEDKSPSHNAATRRGKKLRKGNRKSEVEFAIKSCKKKKPKLKQLCNKFNSSPALTRKVRKSRFYNEQ